MSKQTAKPIVAFSGFTCCAGCQLEILNLEDQLLDILSQIQLVQFRMGSSATHPGPYDVTFVEGSVTNDEELASLRELREKSKVLIAIGACATTAGVNASRNGRDVEEFKRTVYGDASHVHTFPEIKPVSAHVRVDFELQGCPISGEEFIHLLTDLLRGVTPRPKNYPVCVECRFKENVCLMKEGKLCMGPITRGGCEARCPTVNSPCEGCWGPVPQANVDSEINMFSTKGADYDTVLRRFRIFNAASEDFLKELRKRSST